MRQQQKAERMDPIRNETSNNYITIGLILASHTGGWGLHQVTGDGALWLANKSRISLVFYYIMTNIVEAKGIYLAL